MLDQEVHDATDAHLLLVRQADEPPSELIGSLDLPGHG